MSINVVMDDQSISIPLSSDSVLESIGEVYFMRVQMIWRIFRAGLC